MKGGEPAADRGKKGGSVGSTRKRILAAARAQLLSRRVRATSFISGADPS